MIFARRKFRDRRRRQRGNDEKPARLITLDSFYVERDRGDQRGSCPMRRRRGLCPRPTARGATYYQATSATPNSDDYPVINVSWRATLRPSALAGARLPSEAEWEFAAAFETRPRGVERRFPRAIRSTAPSSILRTSLASATTAASSGRRLFDTAPAAIPPARLLRRPRHAGQRHGVGRRRYDFRRLPRHRRYQPARSRWRRLSRCAAARGLPTHDIGNYVRDNLDFTASWYHCSAFVVYVAAVNGDELRRDATDRARWRNSCKRSDKLLLPRYDDPLLAIMLSVDGASWRCW